ncbi:AraC family transcriptional regulator [Phyllobacterium sp. P30BS-XVII]|uniref:AraC family transcriptional regulator n=1 Tax=Phyllobacterium sp. P30BS-XVII TaxID=2587046 RepID=UPI0015FD2E0F|nr:AraC family transcriptional regulator [Phyllobacterium sp. P30BS-XVII]MBA8900488.1 AraC-like DNA-binding protein [Phyllobacterium sp. P30BS-XVII]
MIHSASDRIHSASELLALVDLLTGDGIPAVLALNGTGLSERELSSPDTLISINQMLTAIRNAFTLSDDPHVGLRLGLSMQITMYGIYGFALLSSATCRSACHFAEKYHALTVPMGKQTFRETSKHGIWSTEPDLNRITDPKLYIFKVEHVLGTIISFAKDIADPDFSPAAIRLSFPKPADASVYEKVFNCPIHYDQPDNELLVDVAWLERTPRRAHEMTFSMVRQLCDEMVDRMASSAGVAGRLRQLFVQSAGRFPPIDIACEQLGISARTLRRKLTGEGTSYQSLLDETRLGLAKKYLRETELTMDEIASRLDYSDASNFRHAFRRWTDMTPMEFRSGPSRGQDIELPLSVMRITSDSY